MIYSLSEIDAQCKKAARGAGFAWGHAEEAGKAARWMAAMQLPGVILLAEYLLKYSKHPEHYQAPSLTGNDSDSNTSLCPLVTGACFCDGLIEFEDYVLRLDQVAYPLLLVRSVAMMSKQRQLTLVLSWEGTRIIFAQGRIQILEQSTLNASQTNQVTCENIVDGVNEQGQLAGSFGQFVDDLHWQALAELAHHTYVPSTEESRLGAGPSC